MVVTPQAEVDRRKAVLNDPKYRTWPEITAALDMKEPTIKTWARRNPKYLTQERREQLFPPLSPEKTLALAKATEAAAKLKGGGTGKRAGPVRVRPATPTPVDDALPGTMTLTEYTKLLLAELARIPAYKDQISNLQARNVELEQENRDLRTQLQDQISARKRGGSGGRTLADVLRDVS